MVMSKRMKRHQMRRSCLTPARFGLVFINLLVLVLGSGLCYIGGRGIFEANHTLSSAPNASASGGNGSGNGSAAGAATLFGDPYTTLLVVAVCMVVFSLMGCVGTLKFNAYLLFAYYTVLLLLLCGMAYLAIFTLAFTAKAQEYVTLYWSYVKRMIPAITSDATVSEVVGYIEEHLKAAGAICVVLFVVLLLALALTSFLMGHEYTVQKMMISINVVTFLLGLGIVVLGILAGQFGYSGEWTIYVTSVCGALAALLSVLGCCGVRRASKCMLCVHWVGTVLILILVLVGGIYCFVEVDSVRRYMKDNWQWIQQKLFSKFTLEDAILLVEVRAGREGREGRGGRKDEDGIGRERNGKESQKKKKH